ncbi:glycosyltransferase family 4 protein [Clostridium tarantellae]|uniref:Glycosyltransferase n=1 Tax=Clostridium tarantellae TaxID=39493 RepID=A0A6I1MQB3_9CLOT|nr:glycosyltransferase family 4 protein [Clostridium tarantellae]MPQ43061.1 glycosyltransferase [Clostridium tarantellae]
MEKVLYITTVSSTINIFLTEHIKMLIKNGYEVHCASSIDKLLNEELKNNGVIHYEIPFVRNPLSFNNVKAFIELIKINKRNRYNIIHVHTPIASIYGRILKIIYKNIKIIYTVHGYHFLKEGTKLGWLLYYPIEKIMAKFTDVTITINEDDFKITKDKLKPKQTYLVNGVGIDLNIYKNLSLQKINLKRKELNLKSNDFIILMIAELNKNKNHIQLIKALELLKNKYCNIKVLCVGEGPLLEYLIEECTNRNLKEDIKFLGFRTDINELINCSDLGILLSYREGLPRCLMEFMANGKKIIATNIRGCKDLIRNEEVGFLVNKGDYKGTAKAIEYCYLNKKNNFFIPKEIYNYDINNILKDIETIYDSI